jgi:hypothetical protein
MENAHQEKEKTRSREAIGFLLERVSLARQALPIWTF